MRHGLLLLFALAFGAAPALAQTSPVGDWSGTLDVGQPLELILRVAAADGGALAATIDVPAQGAFGLPASAVEARNDSLFVAFDPPGVRLALAVAAPDSLHGTFTQGMARLPLAMTPAAPLRRPQTPQPPFPYVEEDVTVESAPGVTLAGTFVRPPGAGPFAGVVLITGSGAQDRDESLFGHQPFAVLADALARNGIASLRLDDRGTGASTGDYATATLDDLLADARAAAGWLAARSEVRHVGAIGHSEGGLTAVRLAPSLDFVVALAGPAVRGAELYVRQQARAAQMAGLDSTDAAAFGAAIGATLAPMLAAPTAADSVLAPAMEAALNEGLRPMSTRGRTMLGLAGPSYAQVRQQLVGFLLSPGFRSFVAYDPGPDLSAVRVPTLMLFGGRDVQVDAAQNASVARVLLAGTPGAEVIVVEDANHLFQTAETGAVAEYGVIEETMAPATLNKITGWIRDLVDGMEAGTAR